LDADQLAAVAGQAVGAGGADLAMMFCRRGFRDGVTMREIHRKFRRKFRVEGVRPVREHARQISMGERQLPPQYAGMSLNNQLR
jgi:hypothetical protein